MPSRLSEEQKRVLEELREGIGAEAYEDPEDEGFFGRLRSALR